MKDNQAVQELSIPLHCAPLLAQFLKRIIAFYNMPDVFLPFNCDWENELYIEEMCQCGQSDCATVYLKRKSSWKDEDLASFIINTSKGIVILHFLSNGRMEIEALDYDDFPYKSEVTRLLNGVIKPSAKKEFSALDGYFQDLSFAKMTTIVLDD